MYDRSTMHRAPSYTYPQYTVVHTPMKTYPTAHHSSSAFSASANPDEDWTKISDLAERRRIQNRIAQRNYRKKLKKRLEDLERRASSSSASPERKQEEFLEPEHPVEEAQTASGQSAQDRTPDVLAQQYVLPADDRGMFSQQFTRQLSTSPPPFTTNPFPSIDSSNGFNPCSGASYSYDGLPSNGIDVYGQYYQSSNHYQYVSAQATPIKQEYYADDPFSISYATMAGSLGSYSQVAALTEPFDTPPLSDSLEFQDWDEDPRSPRTPVSIPMTPPLFCD